MPKDAEIDYPVVNMPLNLYCSECNLLMPIGVVASMINAATYKHFPSCPEVRMRHFAAHKQPDTGMSVNAK